MRQIVCLVVPGIMLLIVLTVFLRRFVNDVNNVLGIIKRDDLGYEVIVISQLIGIFVVAVYRSLFKLRSGFVVCNLFFGALLNLIMISLAVSKCSNWIIHSYCLILPATTD